MHEANTTLLDILGDNSVKMVYQLNYRPECPEVADSAVFLPHTQHVSLMPVNLINSRVSIRDYQSP